METPTEHVKTTGNVNTSELLEKEEVKNVGKGQKNLKQRQENILMQIENANIEKHVKELTEKFDPPLCKNCPKRRADRVCINKECGAKYMQIICGKCHADVHAKATKKPEIDIEEYFVKLAQFMNEQKYQTDAKQSQRIDTENLRLVFNEFKALRESLASLQSKIGNEIDGYQSPQQMHTQLQGSITKALSLCEYENIQEQLRSIKKSVIFQKNKFFWNDAGQKFNAFNDIFRQLEDNLSKARKTISKSFIGGLQIDLDEIDAIVCTSLSYGHNSGNVKGKDGQLKIGAVGATQCQYYLNYQLDPEKKYKMRFQFQQNPQNYIMVGIMPLSMVQNQWVYNVPNEYFCKRFFNNSPTQECSRIVRGSEMCYYPKTHSQVEMRIDMAENYMDFTDYPEHKHINANHTHYKLRNEKYVIAFAFYQSQSVIIEQFEEVSSLGDI